jgi:hypothetical protein
MPGMAEQEATGPDPMTISMVITPVRVLTCLLTQFTEAPPIIWAVANTAAAIPAR